jgi:nucleoid-associated protein YgaU
VEGPVTPPARRTLTPAVLASALFVVACAAAAITFVASRGGLQMPIAAAGPSAVPASPGATAGPVAVGSASPGATPFPPPSAAPTVAPSTAPSPGPTAAPSPTPAGSPDPLTALPGCPDLPGCYEYTIQRGDSLSGVASRYAIPVSIVLALNPEITDPGTIVVGDILYLGRDPFLRLPRCEGVPDCSLYTVRPGDRLSTIAGRFSISVESILAANPAITDPNAIFSGQVIRLPHPEG